MHPSFSKLIDNAHKTLHGGLPSRGDEEIVAVVPSQPTSLVKPVDVAAGAAVTLIGLVATPLSALPILRLQSGKFRTRHAGADEKSLYHSLLLIFRRSRLDVHHQRRGHPTEFVESYSYDRVHSYGRQTQGMAIETWLRVDDFEFMIHGWYERDLRPVLSTVGISVDPIPGAETPIRRLDNPGS